MPRHRRIVRTIASNALRLCVDAATVVATRCALLARGAASTGEAVRMVAEKPVAFAKASVAASAAATAALVARSFNPVAAWLEAESASTSSIAGAARANRKRLAGADSRRRPFGFSPKIGGRVGGRSNPRPRATSVRAGISSATRGGAWR